MKHLIVLVALLAACKTTPNGAPDSAGRAGSGDQPAKAGAPSVKEISAASLVDRSGDSVETAVSVPVDAPNGGVDFENDWIFAQYGRFKRDAGGTGTASGRRYDVVKIELPGGEKKTIYFDITENWAHWSPAQPK